MSSYVSGAVTLVAAQVKSCAMSLALEFMSPYITHGQDATVMSTDILDGIELTVDVKYRDLGTLNIDQPDVATGQYFSGIASLKSTRESTHVNGLTTKLIEYLSKIVKKYPR